MEMYRIGDIDKHTNHAKYKNVQNLQTTKYAKHEKSNIQQYEHIQICEI